MDRSRPAHVGDAGALLMRALMELAAQRPDVRAALATLLAALEEGAPCEPTHAEPATNKAEADAGAGAGAGAENSLDLAQFCEPPQPSLVTKVITPRPVPEREELPSREPRRVELSVIVRRARWKAAACRLAIDKRAAKPDDNSTERIEDNLRRQRAALEDCWAWMLDSPRSLPDDRLLGDVASCYDTVALAAEATCELKELGALNPKPPAELLYLLAESQSALLSSLHKCDLRGDSDQRDLFLWLKDQTTRHRIYVDRHMRLDDPADSTGSSGLTGRIQALVAGRTSKLRQGRARTQLLNKVRYHARKAAEAGGASEADLHAVEAAAGEWLDVGLPAADVELGALVRDIVAEAGSVGDATAQVLSVGEEFQLAKPVQPRRDAVADSRPLLEGRRVLLLGTPDHGHELEGLAPALGLASLRFVALGEGEGEGEGEAEAEAEDMLPMLEAEVGDPETDLVMIAYRLPQETYTRFKELCMELERPFVRLPGSLAPQDVAHQVLRQVAWRLRQDASKA